MMSPDLHEPVRLEDLIEILHPTRLRRTIDAPIDAVTHAFLARKPRAGTTPEFNRAITRFVRALHARALGFRRIVSTAEAYATAVRMLNHAYDPGGTHGYELALLAVVRENQETIETVLRAITEGIKDDERQKYRNWIYTRYVQFMSWSDKCALAAEVIRHHSTAPDNALSSHDPRFLANHLPELIDAHIAAITAACDPSPRQHPQLPRQIPSPRPIALG